jgi:hypothetical protein
MMATKTDTTPTITTTKYSVLTPTTPTAAQIAEMAAKNMVWVPASGSVRGHWETKKSATPFTVKVKRRLDWTPAEAEAHRARITNLALLKAHTKTCADTGMPAELVPLCVEGLMAGASMDEIIARLQEAGVPPEVAAEAAAVATAPSRKLLLYGGIGAAGLVLLLLLRKRK